MHIALVWAMARNGVIGRDNKLPWYLPGDLKYFKRVTTGKPAIMGRKTYDSIGRPLPNRTNIIVTRSSGFSADGVRVVGSLDEAYDIAKADAEINGVDEIIVMGGAEIYRQALPHADRLYVTQVHADVEGDTYFPEVDWSQYREIGREDYQAEGSNPYDYSFLVYEKVE